MAHAADDLRTAVARFRRARAELYLARLAGSEAGDPHLEADLVAPCQEARLERYGDLAGELNEAEHTALGAHVLRAHVERAVRGARREAAGWAVRQARAAGEDRSLCAHWSDAMRSRDAGARGELLAASERALDVHEAQEEAQRRAGAAAAEAFRLLSPGRHPDAGPENGSEDDARAFLDASADLTREATRELVQQRGMELRHVGDLFAALGCHELADFRREGRGPRVGELWRPLGLRDVLNRAVRVCAPHAAGWPGAQVLVRVPAATLAIAPSCVEAGLVSELAWVEASGRALGFALVSRALPIELRQPAVGSVARALGQVAVMGLARPSHWQRQRGVGAAQARQLARATATFSLLRARLHAAALLGRGLGREELAELASRAVGASVPPNLASALLLRLSPGGDGRAALQAVGIAAALRDRFDEDWLRNPRAAEPWLGACLRGGEASVESLAQTLGADRRAGLSMLAELF